MSNQSLGFDSFTHAETQTGGGQFVTFSARPDEVETVKAFLADHVRTIRVPTTRRVTTIDHAWFARDSRYDMTQHKYAGGGAGYIEALEIRSPPDGRLGAMVHEYHGLRGSVYYEFEAVAQAISAWETSWGANDLDKRLQTCPGFIRRVPCGLMSPWFYAVGDQMLRGDFVFPDTFEEDSVFQFGRKFIVYDREGFPEIKICYGMSTFSSRPQYSRSYEPEQRYRLVTWHDGTVWDEHQWSSVPTPLQDDQLWIHEAIGKFVEFLAGRETEFAIEFRDGSRFNSRYRPANPKSKTAEGLYQVKLCLADGQTKNSDVVHWKPSAEHPTFDSYVQAALEANPKTKGATIVEIIRVKGELSKRKWTGVYDPAVSNRIGPPTITTKE